MITSDARLWHPWLRVNGVLRAMLHERWSAEAWPQVKAEFQEGARAQESDPVRRVVQLSSFRISAPRVGRISVKRVSAEEASDDATASSFGDRRALPAHVDRDGLRRVRVGAVGRTHHFRSRGGREPVENCQLMA